MKTVLLISLLILSLVFGGCKDNIPIGDKFIVNVTYIMIIENNGTEERVEDSFIWKPQIDCYTGQAISYMPQPNLGEGNVSSNSTLKILVGYEPSQYVDCGDYIFKGWYNTQSSYYLDSRDYRKKEMYKIGECPCDTTINKIYDNESEVIFETCDCEKQ